MSRRRGQAKDNKHTLFARGRSWAAGAGTPGGRGNMKTSYASR